MAEKFLKVGKKEYTVAPLTFSPESVELLELSVDLGDEPKHVARAFALTYRIIIDCLVRGGSVKDEAEAKALLSTLEVNAETIQQFIQLMVNVE